LVESGAIQGRNDFGNIGYDGPCPPQGNPHRYFFRIYALDTKLQLKAEATRREFERAANGHILATGHLMGTYKRAVSRAAGHCKRWTMRYQDRTEAGRLLAERLAKYKNRPDVVILALPRGGVPVAYEVAQALNAPLDVFVVRKLGVPGQEELAMGAIASGGVR